jgi:low affinity Fe/Cu permease
VSAQGEPEPLERESFFEKIADWVSAAMGRPTNILVWLVLVIAWTGLFALGIVNAAGTFLPGWFTSEGYNFPLNLVTTVAELFIGFLVAAASNRSERTLSRILAHQTQVGDDDLAADRDSEQLLANLQRDFAALQREHAAQTQKLDQALELLASIGGRGAPPVG